MPHSWQVHTGTHKLFGPFGGSFQLAGRVAYCIQGIANVHEMTTLKLQLGKPEDLDEFGITHLGSLAVLHSGVVRRGNG